MIANLVQHPPSFLLLIDTVIGGNNCPSEHSYECVRARLNFYQYTLKFVVSIKYTYIYIYVRDYTLMRIKIAIFYAKLRQQFLISVALHKEVKRASLIKAEAIFS